MSPSNLVPDAGLTAQELAQILDASQTMIRELGGTILFCSGGICRLYGWQKEEMIGRSSRVLLRTEFPRPVEEIEDELRRHGQWTGELKQVRRDGATVWVTSHCTARFSQQGSLVSIIEVHTDITERKEVEGALRQAQESLSSLIESTHDLIWSVDRRRRAVIFNTAAREHLASNYGSHVAAGMLVEDYLPPERAAFWHMQYDRAVAEGTHWTLMQLSGGRTLEWTLNPIINAGETIGIAVFGKDITDRVRAEEALQQSELLNKQVLNNLLECIFVLDVTSEGRFKFAQLNAAEEKAVGLSSSEVSGKFVEDVLAEEVAQKVIAHYRHCLEAGTLITYEDELNLPIGRKYFRTNLIPLRDADGRIHRLVGCCSDLTELRHIQEQALARQKLESMGVLASGIAHDFNNLLGGILASAELALAERGDGSFGNEELLRIQTAAIRGAEIVRQLMIFGGAESPAFEPVDLSFLIEEMLQLLKISISKHATLEIDLGENLRAAQANPTQIRQVVMNLVTNASEAIGQRQGVIRVTTGLMKLDRESSALGAANLPDGDYLELEISDTGCGITPRAQARIFDPFFTTKHAGRGMGLAVVQGIIRSHGGAIHLVSAPGQGTTFRILLPSTSQNAQQIQSPITPAVGEAMQRRAGTVLVVEDEDVLRIAVSKALRKRGYSVIEADDGSAAMDLIRAHQDGVDLLLLDVTIPGMSSREVFENAKRLRPGLKVILTSAYGKETVEASFAGLPVERFIRKPFRLGDLVSMLETLSPNK
jgi:PAS domain S-box-containing protein